ncbi:MAG: 50S ribosomal protein L31e [Candidatus Thermoplasmatota archaeon]|nr:50S ribosomal protein L31e [Candidatus Thermoplasmatota archaeon]MBU1941934.1 50S ribosomal protein L31e [Candidatus Thermoplasmatota archaeon]
MERIYVVPLRQPKIGPSSKAAPRAIKQVRNFMIKHMKVPREDVWIDDSLNHAIWAHGKFKIPSKIRVRAIKFEDGVVEVTLPELGILKSRRELLKEEREKKTPILRREEAEMEPAEGGAGTAEYDIAPSVDGEVKIKKKKAPKKKTDTEEKPKSKRKPAKKTESKPSTKKKQSAETPKKSKASSDKKKKEATKKKSESK